MSSRGPSDEIERLRAEVARLEAENAALRGETRGAAGPVPSTEPTTARPTAAGSRLTRSDKLALFRRRFAGRSDVYPLRWTNAAGRSGYSPACRNEWVPGVCGKPAVKCGACPNAAFRPVTDEALLDHLQGRATLGVYPLLPDDTCRFLAVDFDEADWRRDALAYATTARAARVPVLLEISRSGAGAHAWTFFAEPVLARDARQLGAALITRTCREGRLLSLGSYDRMFPSQDTLPAGGFGNLIALPLQHEPRSRGASVFVDDDWRPFEDPWAALEAVESLSAAQVATVLAALGADGPPLDAVLPTDDERERPWERPAAGRGIAGPRPERLRLTLAQQLYVDKAGVPPRWLHALVRLAAFQNPAFYQAQAMRRSVWNLPRLIGCARNHPQHVALPRGLRDEVATLARRHDVPVDLDDRRADGTALPVEFTGRLSEPQCDAVDALAAHDTGVLWAPTGFGKTVVAAALIARRRVSTLVLVHRAELLEQWRARLAAFLTPVVEPGTLGAGRDRLTRQLDIALLQSWTRRAAELPVDAYGQVIVDECHHVPAVSFEQVLSALPARFVTGLTATPIRRDGQHPIITLQLGPVRWSERKPGGGLPPPLVRLQEVPVGVSTDPAMPLTRVLAALAGDEARTATIAGIVERLVRDGRRVLLLTERTDHVDALAAALAARAVTTFPVHGRLTRRQRADVLEACFALGASTPFVLLATGRLIGEGFDDPRLDALVLALPFSWKGTLQQYVGRLYRVQPGKPRPQIVDVLDTGHRVLERMGAKRRAAYLALGAEIVTDGPAAGVLDLR